jgi:hypothetical protein
MKVINAGQKGLHVLCQQLLIGISILINPKL